MKVDTSGIDPDQLGRAVGEAYGLEIEHAWAELQLYIPAPRAEMAAAIRQIATILARIYGAD
jgi:hypothetical protein